MKTSVITKKPTGLQKAGYPVFITKRIIKEALNNSSMNYQSTKKIKCDFIFFSIFSGLSATENGNTSMCCGNSELIRVSLINRVQAVFNCIKMGLLCADSRIKKAGKCNLAIFRGQTPLNTKVVEKLFYVQVPGDSVFCAGEP
jgi:hypothetical protein